MRHSYPLSFFKGILIPVLLWMIFTPWSPWLDLKVSHAFYKNGSFVSDPFLDWIYIYGLWPAWLMIAIALIGTLMSFFKSYHSWRKPCLFLLLSFAVGSGLIIHGILKDHWGRPRPRQVIEFGGQQSFRAYYQPNFKHLPEPSKSFACGHAALGFYFFVVALLGTIYQSKVLYWSGLGLAWGLGGLLSIVRIAQGGHFLSDTIATALIMWLTAWGFAYFLLVGHIGREGKNDERVDA